MFLKQLLTILNQQKDANLKTQVKQKIWCIPTVGVLHSFVGSMFIFKGAR